MVLVGTIPIILKSRELVLVVAESSFRGNGFCSLFFNFCPSQVVTSAVSIAEPLVLFSNSSFGLFYSFVCSLDFF